MDWIFDNRIVLINIAYLIAAVCFIVGLKLLSSPATARRGNQIAALGMTIAVVFATINVVGGFLVTDRMLEMFKRKPSKPESK